MTPRQGVAQRSPWTLAEMRKVNVARLCLDEYQIFFKPQGLVVARQFHEYGSGNSSWYSSSAYVAKKGIIQYICSNKKRRGETQRSPWRLAEMREVNVARFYLD